MGCWVNSEGGECLGAAPSCLCCALEGVIATYDMFVQIRGFRTEFSYCFTFLVSYNYIPNENNLGW